jgi:hypothetical protein
MQNRNSVEIAIWPRLQFQIRIWPRLQFEILTSSVGVCPYGGVNFRLAASKKMKGMMVSYDS